MHCERIGAGGVAVVRVSRDGGDDPVRVEVPRGLVRDPFWTESGGCRRLLARPTLAVRVRPEAVPGIVRSGEHVGGELVLLVEPEDNGAEAYAELVAEAACRKPRRRQGARRYEARLRDARARAETERS